MLQLPKNWINFSRPVEKEREKGGDRRIAACGQKSALRRKEVIKRINSGGGKAEKSGRIDGDVRDSI